MQAIVKGMKDEKRELILGGVLIANQKGTNERIDGDVICLAAANSIIKFFDKGDFDSMFPTKNLAFNQMSAEVGLIQLLKKAKAANTSFKSMKIKLDSYANIDSYLEDIKINLGAILLIDEKNIHINVNYNNNDYICCECDVEIVKN